MYLPLGLLWTALVINAETKSDFPSSTSCGAGSPSYGDLMLKRYSLFLYISLAPDGMELSEYTYPVCGDNFNEENKVTQVISRQLGFERCTLEFRSMKSQNSFGSAGINCTGSEYHIMRCHISSPETSAVPCRNFIVVHCRQEDSLYEIDSTIGNKAFQGQVLLHPHFPTGRGIATASMGLVGVKQEGDNCRNWRFVEVSGHVDLALASTLCRQMGFTHASAVFTKHEAESLFHLNFSLWLTWHAYGSSSILTSEINCQGLSHECLGCCNYTKHLACGQSYESKKREVNEDSILVLRCSAAFYNDKKVPSEGGNLCSFHQNVTKTKCANEKNDDTMLYIISGVLGMAVLALFIVIILQTVKCVWNRRNQQAGYDNLDQQHQNQN